MLNFRSNSFFLQFSVLFFFIVIFGFWSIDLNSEEIYIAFSFFVMLVLSFILFRANLMLVFTRILNRKYSVILNALLKIRRLNKNQSVDFNRRFLNRRGLLNPAIFLASFTNFWSCKFLRLLRMSNFLQVRRSLFIALISISGVFSSTFPSIRSGNFSFRLSPIFYIRLS